MPTTGAHGIIIPDPSTSGAIINDVRDLAIQTENALNDVAAHVATGIGIENYATKTYVGNAIAAAIVDDPVKTRVFQSEAGAITQWKNAAGQVVAEVDQDGTFTGRLRDTGWRALDVSDVTGTIRDPAKPGTLHIRRIGDRVSVRIGDMALTAGGAQGVIFATGTLPSGFRASAPSVSQLRDQLAFAAYHTVVTNLTVIRWLSYWTGTTQSQTRPTGGTAQGEFSWLTDDTWPSTLPGTPA